MNTFSITDLRHKTLDVVNAAKANGYVHIIQNSKADIAIVDSQYLLSLQEAYEDNMDTIEFDRTVNDKPVITLDEYLKKRAKQKTKAR